MNMSYFLRDQEDIFDLKDVLHKNYTKHRKTACLLRMFTVLIQETQTINIL